MKSRLVLLAFVTVFTFLVSGLTVAQEVEITYWDTMNDQERVVFRTIVEECAEELDIRVNYEYIPFDQAQATYRTAAQADNAPDVLRTEVAWGPEFAALGYTLDLTDFVSDEERASYLEAPFNYNTWGGRIWGLPQVTDAPALLYNKAMFEAAGVEVPTTLEELYTVAQTISEKLSTPEKRVYGLATLWGEYPFQAIMWGYGGSLITVNEDGTFSIGVNSPETIAALEFTKSMLDAGIMGPGYDPSNQYGNSMTAFKEGVAAMHFIGPWATADILSGPAFADASNLGVVPIPPGPGGQGSPVGGHGYTIYAGTDYPEESLAFIRCLNKVDNQVKLALELNLVPTLLEAYDNPQLAENDILQGFLAQMQVATNRPVLVAGGSIYTEFGPQYQAFMLGTKSAQEAMDAVAAAWELLLESEPPVPGE